MLVGEWCMYLKCAYITASKNGMSEQPLPSVWREIPETLQIYKVKSN